jgi:hypothetical protein
MSHPFLYCWEMAATANMLRIGLFDHFYITIILQPGCRFKVASYVK